LDYHYYEEDVETCIIEDFISIIPKHPKLDKFMELFNRKLYRFWRILILLVVALRVPQKFVKFFIPSTIYYFIHPIQLYIFGNIKKKWMATHTTRKPKGSTCKKMAYIEDSIN